MICGATEYRDPWRGLRILVPRGWWVRRSGGGLFLHNDTPGQAIVVQPRLGVATREGLVRDLLAWLKRLDPEAWVQVMPGARAGLQLAAARVCPAAGEVSAGAFALQVGGGCGLISGFLAPAECYDAASRIAVRTLSSLASIAVQPRQLWSEPAEKACTALVPEGWRARAMLHRANVTGLPQVSFEARAGESITIMASAEGKLYLEPGLRSAVLSRLAGGVAGRGRFVDAGGYAERHLLPTLAREASGVRIDAVIARPDLTPTLAAQEAALAGVGTKEMLLAQPNAADVVFSLTVRGCELRQVSRVLTMRVPPALARNRPLWLAATRHTYRTPAEELAANEPVLEGVALSFHEAPEWRARELARAAAQLGRRPPEPLAEPDEAALLAEAESLIGACGGQPLAIHERPFAPPDAPLVEGTAADLSDLCGQAPWMPSV